MKNMFKKLGRISKPDTRDQGYLIKDKFKLITPAKITAQYWNADGWWGNQGNSSACVGYSWAHWIEDGPEWNRLIKSLILE
jgi:hypothetical protein